MPSARSTEPRLELNDTEIIVYCPRCPKTGQRLTMTNGASSGYVRCRLCHGWIEITAEVVEPFREEDVRCLAKPRYRAVAAGVELHS